jgi:serine protease Do
MPSSARYAPGVSPELPPASPLSAPSPATVASSPHVAAAEPREPRAATNQKRRLTNHSARERALFAAGLALTSVLLLGTVAQGKPPKPPVVPPGSATLTSSGGKLSLSAAPAVSASGSAAAAPEQAPALDPIERARRGVVTLTRGGDVVGLGTVLKDDGRILTALSPLGDGNDLAIRYPDGTSVPARVGHSDRIWDLALLVPQVGRWPEGLTASDGDPLRSGAQLRAFVPGKQAVQAATVVVKDKRSLLGADGQLVRDVLNVTTKVGPKEFGSPVVDETGGVVGVLGRACVPLEKGPCAPTAFAAPTDALRAFLRTTPVSAVPPAAWLGIQGVPDRSGLLPGVRVASVSPESPADEAGLRGGADKTKSDVVVALDDKPIASPEALAAALREKAAGERAKLLVLREGKLREIQAVLRAVPKRLSSVGVLAKRAPHAPLFA